MPEKYQMERILAALKALTTVGYIKRESFMEECRISSRTFDRFIADLKLYVPVIYDDVKNRYVIDRTKFSQISLDYPEKGGVELMSRVLSFGTNAEIVSPPELKAQWQNEINAMGKKFLKE